MKIKNINCAIFLFMKIMLGSDSDLDSSNSDIDSFEITSVSNQITTSESENDEVFYTADDAGFLYTNDFEYVEIDCASKYGNLETLNNYTVC